MKTRGAFDRRRATRDFTHGVGGGRSLIVIFYDAIAPEASESTLSRAGESLRRRGTATDDAGQAGRFRAARARRALAGDVGRCGRGSRAGGPRLPRREASEQPAARVDLRSREPHQWGVLMGSPWIELTGPRPDQDVLQAAPGHAGLIQHSQLDARGGPTVRGCPSIRTQTKCQ